MNAQTSIAKPRRGKLSLKPPSGVSPVDDEPIAAIVVPSSPSIFQLKQLRRAPENVRHTRSDEDIVGLADDIAAHGLLQSLIGYQDDEERVHIVGGGRRFQALRVLEDRFAIDGSFPVPVLIRDVDDAVELSLAENLQQRTMSPVDEFFAFKALMEHGDTSPAELAKRFGFSERVVKQRLRLAELATPVLDALADREISLDVAMGYASTQDRQLQEEVFKTEKRRGRDAHSVDRVRHSLALKTYATDHPLFRFVGADEYERRGGTYEDDLFNDAGTERRLAKPLILEEAAREMIQRGYGKMLAELVCDLAPTITGFLVPVDLRVKSWGNNLPKAPPGFVAVERYDHAPLWRTIRNNAIETKVMIGVDDAGKLVAWPKVAYVEKAQQRAIDAQKSASPGSIETQEQREARIRRQDINRIARQLAVGPFAGTRWEGTVYWPERHEDRSRAVEKDGKNGWWVFARFFVTDAAIAAQQKAAEAEYDAEIAAQAAALSEAEKRAAALAAMDPPAIAVLDGQAWQRAEDGSYFPIDDEEDGGSLPSWIEIVDNFDVADIGETFTTREAFDAAMNAAHAGDGL